MEGETERRGGAIDGDSFRSGERHLCGYGAAFRRCLVRGESCTRGKTEKFRQGNIRRTAQNLAHETSGSTEGGNLGRLVFGGKRWVSVKNSCETFSLRLNYKMV